jgi:hypothetical protein
MPASAHKTQPRKTMVRYVMMAVQTEQVSSCAAYGEHMRRCRQPSRQSRGRSKHTTHSNVGALTAAAAAAAAAAALCSGKMTLATPAAADVVAFAFDRVTMPVAVYYCCFTSLSSCHRPRCVSLPSAVCMTPSPCRWRGLIDCARVAGTTREQQSRLLLRFRQLRQHHHHCLARRQHRQQHRPLGRQKGLPSL